MRWQDITLLGKKILVGIVLVLVPFVIFFGGVRATQRLLTKQHQPQSSVRPE